jgi:hypothetical protein
MMTPFIYAKILCPDKSAVKHYAAIVVYEKENPGIDNPSA